MAHKTQKKKRREKKTSAKTGKNTPTKTRKIDLPDTLDFEAVEKIIKKFKLEKLRKEEAGLIVVNAKNVSKVDIVGLQFLLSLKKSGVQINGFDDVIKKFPFEIEIN